ncbi:MAG TPA: Crp/Fnr family transcriptional regulator [Candidatus Limnocylindrales bacterium]|nr:Crp/Fnr family transcriptional regulator [Candidatus Limnocylindrales bacterium]
MEGTSVSELLDGTWFAADMPDATRARLGELATVVDIPQGAIVVQEGLPCRAMGIVVDGRIALRLGLPGGEVRTILTVDPGDVFGWSAVLPPAIATSTGIAIVPSRAILIDGEQLRTAMSVDCELAAAIFHRLLVSVSRRLTATRVQLLDLYRVGPEPW